MLTQLKEYMFTSKLTVSTCPIVSEKQQDTITIRKKPSKSPWLMPRFDDTLFWCFYIIHHSLSDYELTSNSGFKEERSFKIAFVEAIRNKPDFIKANKISRTTLENEMVNDKKISLLGFEALCLFYNIRAIVIQARMFVETGPTAGVLHVIQFRKGKYELLMKQSIDIEEYIKQLIKVKTFMKPLNAQTSYKLADLEYMSKKMGICWEGKARKRDLYDKLLVTLTKEPDFPI